MTKRSQRSTSKLQDLRPLLYLYKDPRETNCCWFHGITFKEFFHAIQLNTHLLFIAYGDLDIEGDESRTDFIDAPPQSVRHITTQDIYRKCGDFMWIDIPPGKSSKNLSPDDLAHLLYLSKTFTLLPNRTALFRSLQNRFVYLAHDDGYVLKLYCRHRKDLIELIERVITQKAHAFGIRPPQNIIGRKILQRAPQGALIEFANNSGSIPEIPLSTVGPFTCMDHLLNGLFDGRIQRKQTTALGVSS